MKRIDTHTHPIMSKRFLFNPAALLRLIAIGKKVGLHGVALTEHFHAPEYWRIHEHLAETYACEEGVFSADGLFIIPGAEVNVRPAAHVIVLGEVEELRRLDGSFPELLSRGYQPELREFLDVTDDFELLRIGAHMFRRQKELGKFPASDLRRLHALEVNGKDFGREVMLLVQARALGLPIVAGSDAHHWLQVGVRHTLIHTDEITMTSLLKTVREGLTGYGTSRYTAPRVVTAKLLKTITKAVRKWCGRQSRSSVIPAVCSVTRV